MRLHFFVRTHRLTPELAGIIADTMDLPSILAWRRTCIINYAHATAALKRTLTTAINPFLSHPLAFLDIISRYGAVIGGEVALAFVRRQQPLQVNTLEVFTGSTLYDALLRELLSDPQIAPDIVGTTITISRYPYNLQRDVLETTQLHLRTTRTIHIRRSSTLSPLSPIARSICTAVVNFVSLHSFGCAYPLLTLNNKSLLSDHRTDSSADIDAALMRTLTEYGIDVAVDPAEWHQYRTWSPTPAAAESMKACWRSHYICPEQGRFFGDRGSMVDFLDPLGTPVTALRNRGLPPFGTSVIWRLASSYRCPLSCEARDSTLPNGQTSTAIILMDDPFVRPFRGKRGLLSHPPRTSHASGRRTRSYTK